VNRDLKRYFRSEKQKTLNYLNKHVTDEKASSVTFWLYFPKSLWMFGRLGFIYFMEIRLRKLSNR